MAVSPHAEKLAKELKVELGQIVGTGPSGRIVAKDVEGFATTGSVVAVVPEPVKTAVSGAELGTVVPFTTMQNVVSRNMVESWLHYHH